MRARSRVIKAARDLVNGKGPCLPPSEQWDHDFLSTFLGPKHEDFDRLTDAEIDRVAGFGAHEVRTWVAAAAAARKMGDVQRGAAILPPRAGMDHRHGHRGRTRDDRDGIAGTRDWDRRAPATSTIFYRRFGQPGAVPMLIVHGLSYFSYDWIGPAARIARRPRSGCDRHARLRQVRPQRRRATTSSRRWVATSSRFWIDLGWSKAVLMGHSFGGRVALATAGWKPERVAGVDLRRLRAGHRAPPVVATPRSGSAAARCVRVGRCSDGVSRRRECAGRFAAARAL